VKDVAQSTSITVYYNLLIRQSATSGDEAGLEEELKNRFDRHISLIVAECNGGNGRRRSLQERITQGENDAQLKAQRQLDVDEKIHYVQMEGLGVLMDVGCNSDSIPENFNDLDVWCVPYRSNVTIYFSSNDDATPNDDAGAVGTHVRDIINVEFPSIAQGVDGVYDGVTSDFIGIGADGLGGGSGKYAAVGVGLGCSAVAILTVALLVRGRKRDRSQEATGIIPDRHIRSDDSISDNPTISSGRRAMMSGWDSSVQSDSCSEVCSEVSSRRSSMYGVQLEDGHQSIEIRRRPSYQTADASYLPSSVLKDLLGTDGDLSLDPNDTFDL